MVTLNLPAARSNATAPPEAPAIAPMRWMASESEFESGPGSESVNGPASVW